MSIIVRRINILSIGFVSGILLLAAMYLAQIAVADFIPPSLAGYIVPVLFGGCSGMVISFFIYREKKLKRRLARQKNRLEEFLPICSNCRKIRTPKSDPIQPESWRDIETYIEERTSSRFSHTMCPGCIEEYYGSSYLPCKD